MKNGELSNKQVPHVLLVFEGTLGHLDKDDLIPFRRYLHKKRYTDAAYLWQFFDLACRAVCDLVYRNDVLLEVITFISAEEEYLSTLEYRIQEEEDLPVRKVWATRPEKLARMLSYMPEVAAVYTPSAEHASMLGAKGVHVTRVSDIGR